MFELDFSTYTLAQGPPPPPGERSLQTESGTGEGTPGGGGGGFFGEGGLFLVLLMILVFMIMMTVMGSRREKKKRNEMLSVLKKHDKVQTIGGVIGSIVELKPEQVVLKVDESSNTRITFARSAIQQIVKSSNQKDSGNNAGSRADEANESDAEVEERAA